MFFKRLSGQRSRANSYVDSHDAPTRGQSFDDYSSEKRPDSSRKESQQPASPTEDADMYPRPQQPQETSYAHQGAPNSGHNTMPIRSQAIPPTGSAAPATAMPDLLAQAFNQAIRPYTEKIDQLESQLADMQAWIDQLEQQRAEVHNWIDKRGLRPGMSSFLSPQRKHANSSQMSQLQSQRSWTPPQPMLHRH
jgi:hypothetical protein